MDSISYGTMPQPIMKTFETRSAISQIIAVNVNNIILMVNGMVAGYPTILIPSLSSDDGSGITIEDSQISWIGSLSFVTALIGCFVSGMVTHPIGRCRSIHISSPLIFGSWLIFYFANKIWHIYIALCLLGITCSIVESPILSYKAEISQPHLRGMLSATSTLSVIIGVLLEFILGTIFNWRITALISSVFPLLAFIILFFIPESPHWLIMHNKIDRARRSLAWLRGWTTEQHVEEEFQLILENCEEYSLSKSAETDTSSKWGKWVPSIQIYTRKSFLKPLCLVSFTFMLTNVTGLCTLQTYAVNIFATLNVPMDEYYLTVILGVTEFIGCFISLFFVRYFGKRVMGCTSLFGVAVCNIIVGVYAYVIDVKYLNFAKDSYNGELNTYSWLPLFVLIAMAFIGHTGIRVLPWILLAEIFSHETRAMGCGVGSAVYYLMAFFANKIFLWMISVLHLSGTYWFYATVSIFGVVIMYLYLPETEGKDLQEIIHHFAGVSKLDNKLRKRNVDTKTRKTTTYC
ncbi:hypothetical protein FQR65_LT11813 [Abscondita terminalis]|nr:hypothetical protein FQR65_LT11813 [Abscondita terminalis]